MKYSKRYQTCWHDTDACRRMRPSQLLVYMQEASNHHVADTGMTLDDLRDEKKLGFILSKIQIAIYRPLVAYEDIQVQTWTCKGRGFSSPRCFRILKDGEVVAEANSQWALLGIEGISLRMRSLSLWTFPPVSAFPPSLPWKSWASGGSSTPIWTIICI